MPRVAPEQSLEPASPVDDNPQPTRTEKLRGRLRRLPRLPLYVRVGVFLVGWVLVLVGVAGLVLPGIQGVLTIFLGAALLSVVSELAYEGLARLLSRWPRAWRRVRGLRLTTHRWLRRHFKRRG